MMLHANGLLLAWKLPLGALLRGVFWDAWAQEAKTR